MAFGHSKLLLNPSQIPVVAFDQPLFAVAKQMQWSQPMQFGENKFVIMFGGLHIEQAFLKVIGSWLEGSGWTQVLEAAGVASAGTAASFITADHIMRTRRAHQVTICALNALLENAFKNSTKDCENQPTFTK